SAGGWLGSIFGAIFGGANAIGGDILPNREYWAVEEGPEWCQTSTAGTILPAAATAALATGGGRGQTITQNFINPRMQDLATDSQKARRQARIASRESSRSD